MPSLTEVTVNIRNLAFGGEGVGEVTAQSDGQSDLLGITAFVPFTARGESVTASVTARKKNHVKTRLLTVVSPSPARTAPECPHFTSCGGCELQHISYDEQLAAKYDMIRGALAAAKLRVDVLDRLKPVVPGSPYHYRRRVSLHIDSQGRIGFYRENSRSVVPISTCPICVNPISEALPRAADFGRLAAGKITGLLLEADDQGVIAVLKSPYDLAPGEQRQVLAAAKDCFQSAVLFAGEREVGGFGRQILELPLSDAGNFALHVPAGFFSQVNWEVNHALVKYALDYAETTRGQTVFDLYSGAGNFALPLARLGARVTAVELDKRLVAFGRQNSARLGLEKQVAFIEAPVEQFLLKSPTRQTPDLIVADPPRSGLGSLASSLPNTPRLLLVSCHLASFVRDLKALLHSGFRVESITPFDMFAQTSYVEILSVCVRS